MWKKTDAPTPPEPEPVSPPSPRVEPPKKEEAMIGPTIFIRGDISGEENLTVEGRVEGKIDLRKNNVTVGKNGRVKADVHGKTISIEGEVEGNLFGHEKIIVRQSGRVRGNMTAPRVTLEDGARFKGSIDMEGKEEPRESADEELPTGTKAGLVNKPPQMDKKEPPKVGQGLPLDTSSTRPK